MCRRPSLVWKTKSRSYKLLSNPTKGGRALKSRGPGRPPLLPCPSAGAARRTFRVDYRRRFARRGPCGPTTINRTYVHACIYRSVVRTRVYVYTRRVPPRNNTVFGRKIRTRVEKESLERIALKRKTPELSCREYIIIIIIKRLARLYYTPTTLARSRTFPLRDSKK